MGFLYRRLSKPDVWEGENLSGRFDTRPLYQEIDVTTPSTLDPVDVNEIKDEFRVRHDDDDLLLDQYLKQALLDVENYTCRAIGEQTITVYYKLVWDYVWLPRPPHGTISSVTEIDDEGNETTITSSDYKVFGRNELKVEFDSGIDNQLRIVYTAGYDNTEAGLPQWAKSAIRWQTKLYYSKNDDLAINAESGLAVPAYLAAKDYVYLQPE